MNTSISYNPLFTANEQFEARRVPQHYQENEALVHYVLMGLIGDGNMFDAHGMHYPFNLDLQALKVRSLQKGFDLLEGTIDFINYACFGGELKSKIRQEYLKAIYNGIEESHRVLDFYLDVHGDHVVLDLGCGLGGSAGYFASRKGARVEAITIVDEHISLARNWLTTKKLDDRVHVSKMDYHHLDFPDASFDRAYGVESLCHSYDPDRLICEVARVIKSGGKFVRMDGFAVRDAYSGSEKLAMDQFLHGWAVDRLQTVDEYVSILSTAGFKDIVFEDLSDRIRGYSDLISLLSCVGLSAIKLSQLTGFYSSAVARRLGLSTDEQRRNLEASRSQKIALDKGLWQYGIMVATRC